MTYLSRCNFFVWYVINYLPFNIRLTFIDYVYLPFNFVWHLLILCCFLFCVRFICVIGHGRPTLAIRALSHGTFGGKVLLFQSKACHVANFDWPLIWPNCLYKETLGSEKFHPSHFSSSVSFIMLVCFFFIIWWVNGLLGHVDEGL
jgi:hypothetical protein